LLLDLIELLLGGLIAGINLEGASELGESAVKVAALAKDAALINVGGGGLETHARKVGFVIKVRRLQIQRVLVVLKGGVEVVMRLSGPRRYFWAG
jgi:hypothetical protein